MSNNDEETVDKRREIVRLIAMGILNNQSTNQGQALPSPLPPDVMVQADMLLDSYIASARVSFSDIDVFKIFTNTKVYEMLGAAHSTSQNNFSKIEKQIDYLSSIRVQVTTSFLVALLLTVIVFLAKYTPLPIPSPFNKG